MPAVIRWASSTGSPTAYFSVRGTLCRTSWAAALGHRVPRGEMVRHERLEVTLTDRRTGRVRTVTPGVWVVGAVVHADDPLRAVLAALRA